MKRLLKISAFVLLAFVKSATVNAQEIDYKIASLYTYNFAKYMEWPEEYRKGNFVVGVLGTPSTKDYFERYTQKKSIGSQMIIVKQINSLEDAANCHIVFIAYNESGKIKLLTEMHKGKPILLISEKDGLLNKGSAINLYVDEEDANKTKFEINRKNIDNRQLKVANSLLELSD